MPRLTDYQRARIVELAAEGAPPSQIEARFAYIITKQQIYNCINRARADGADIPFFATGSRGEASICITLEPGDRASLIEASRKRGVSPAILARRLVEAIITDNMFDAVLDDQAGAA